ncbi:MAG: IS110 family transposase [Cytophagaceae bacterium]|nr:MAG: IS110 family transposase [Cytophagaceae bacterium]
MEAALKPLKYGIGIDMGKDEFHACISAIDANQRVKIKATRAFKNTSKGILDFLQWSDHHCKQTGVPIHYLMEATGVYYEQLALALHRQRAHVCVVLPQKAKYYIKALGVKTKTDGVDAQALAMMVCQQAMEAWRPISEAMYILRQLTRQYAELQTLKTQIGNQLMALEAGMYHSLTVKNQLETLITELDRQLAQCLKLIHKAIMENAEWKRKTEQICRIKGVGELTVANLITETNEFALFENQRQLMSFAGYDVVENQSGKRVGKTRISKRGNSHIRRALHMPALMMVTYEQRPFMDLYERVFQRTNIKMKGYVAVQRKLLTMIYALWKKDEAYDPTYVPVAQKKVAPTEEATRHQPQGAVLEEANIGELVES